MNMNKEQNQTFLQHTHPLQAPKRTILRNSERVIKMELINSILKTLLNTIRILEKDKDLTNKTTYFNLLSDMISFYRNQWNVSLDWVYEELLCLLQEPSDYLIAAAIDADSRRLWAIAAHFSASAARINPIIPFILLSAAHLRKSGNPEKAREICRSIPISHSEKQEIMSELFMCDVAEHLWLLDYYELLAKIHKNYQPRVYMEIGIATGKSLALARAGTRSLGIDPALSNATQIYHSPENTPQLFKMTSDDFFASCDVCKEMGQSCFDLAFIDGLHYFEQTLRDFINLEKYAGKDSVILIHDCLPVNSQVAKRNRTTAFWTGDVWKIIPCLRTVRPDLEITTVPVSPSGLAIIRRLDPTSTVLIRHQRDIVGCFKSLELPESWPERLKMLNVLIDENEFSMADFLPSAGWS